MTGKSAARESKSVKLEESFSEGRRVLEIEARAVEALVSRLDERFGKAVDVLVRCKGKVVVSGMGKSGLIGQKFAATLASTGTSSFFLHPAEGVHGDLGMLARRDVLVAISNSGETQELLQLLPFVKRLGIPVISMTGRMSSTLSKNSDVALDVSVAEEACPMGLAPTASTTATLALGDAPFQASFQGQVWPASERSLSETCRRSRADFIVSPVSADLPQAAPPLDLHDSLDGERYRAMLYRCSDLAGAEPAASLRSGNRR